MVIYDSSNKFDFNALFTWLGNPKDFELFDPIELDHKLGVEYNPKYQNANIFALLNDH